jgi:hypothetical protein
MKADFYTMHDTNNIKQDIVCVISGAHYLQIFFFFSLGAIAP